MLLWLLLCDVVQRGAAMKIVIYGGSITADRKIHQPNRNEFPVTPYPALLANSRPDWEVKNLGVGAAGVRINFECSLEDADVIVSEYRLNEHNAINLQKWYRALAKHAKIVVVLELWSWLMPPTPLTPSVTVSTIPPGDHRFSVLDLSHEVASKWFKQEGIFTARNMFNDSAVPEKCFAAAREDTAWAKMTMKYCRTNTASYYPGDIQHGRNAYMTFVAKRLEQHLAHKEKRVKSTPWHEANESDRESRPHLFRQLEFGSAARRGHAYASRHAKPRLRLRFALANASLQDHNAQQHHRCASDLLYGRATPFDRKPRHPVLITTPLRTLTLAP